MFLPPARLFWPGIQRTSYSGWHCTHPMWGSQSELWELLWLFLWDNLLLLPEQTVKGKGQREKVGGNMLFAWQISTYSEMRLPLTDLAEVVPSYIKSCMGRAETGVHTLHLYTQVHLIQVLLQQPGPVHFSPGCVNTTFSVRVNCPWHKIT